MRGRTKLILAAGALAWLGKAGLLNPGLWADALRREREVLPGQVKEALQAGKRAQVEAEERLDQQVQDAFNSARQPRA